MRSLALKKSKSLQWDDLRYFLALYRHKKLVAAGRALNVDHTTVSRRIRELEAVLNTHLFEKKETGFEVTCFGKNLISFAENIESELAGLEEKVTANDDVKGSVKVGSPESFSACFLASRFAKFLRQYNGLQIDLLPEENNNFRAYNTDIWITSKRPEKGRFVVRRLTDYRMGLFASTHYLDSNPFISNKSDLEEHKIIGYADNDVGNKDLFLDDSKVLSDQFLFKNCNVMAQYKILKEGYGLCFLPKFMVDESDGVVQVLPEEIDFTSTLWLVIREDVSHLSRIKKVADFIADTTYQYRASFV